MLVFLYCVHNLLNPCKHKASELKLLNLKISLKILVTIFQLDLTGFHGQDHVDRYNFLPAKTFIKKRSKT